MDYDNILLFLEALKENMPEKWGREVKYTCPVCGGEVISERSEYNGHIHARCEKCGLGVME